MQNYTIEQALLGTPYRSRRGEGIVISAEKRDGVWAGNNNTVYVVEIKPWQEYGKIATPNFFATISVQTENI